MINLTRGGGGRVGKPASKPVQCTSLNAWIHKIEINKNIFIFFEKETILKLIVKDQKILVVILASKVTIIDIFREKNCHSA